MAAIRIDPMASAAGRIASWLRARPSHHLMSHKNKSAINVQAAFWVMSVVAIQPTVDLPDRIDDSWCVNRVLDEAKVPGDVKGASAGI
jgi:hypothetical protein